MNPVYIWVYLHTLLLGFVLYPINIQFTLCSPIYGVLLVPYFMTPNLPHVRDFDANFGTFPIQWSYFVAFFQSHVTTVNPYIKVEVFKASLHTLYLVFNDKFGFLVIARPIPRIVDNIASASWYLCGVGFTVYLNSRFNFQAFLFAVFWILVFSPAFSHITNSTDQPFCFYF